jgi:hypothetical protein
MDVSKSNRAAVLLVNIFYIIISIYYMTLIVYLRGLARPSGVFSILTSLAFPAVFDDFHKEG